MDVNEAKRLKELEKEEHRARRRCWRGGPCWLSGCWSTWPKNDYESGAQEADGDAVVQDGLCSGRAPGSCGWRGRACGIVPGSAPTASNR
jgi:hypothetical protein